MGGAVKGVVNPIRDMVMKNAVQPLAKAVGAGMQEGKASVTPPAAVTAPAAEPVPPLAPAAEPVTQRRKRGRAASLLATDSTSAPQTASKALLGQ